MDVTGELTQAPDTVKESPHQATARVRVTDRWLASRVQRQIDAAAVRLRLWDGSTTYRGLASPIGDLVVGDRWTLVGLAINPDLYFGESYMAGRLEIDGPLEPVIEAITAATMPTRPSWTDRLRVALGSRNTLSHARDNVHHHYDLGNDFYRLWLDRELVYTCAYFATPHMSLDEAQVAKMDLVCRKLRLRPGELVVEAGCGWGSLAIHMARHYGCRVRAFNVSREQLDYARSRAQREGLGSRVEFIDDDYRNVSGTCDAFVSVGMLEHVGLPHYPSLSEVLRRTLNHNGRGFLHFIGRDWPRPLNTWIRRRIFPGAYPPTLAQVTSRIIAPAGMSVIDVENLRLHYARTLSHWTERYGLARDRVRASYGERFERAWDLYLAGSQAAFATGCLQLFQILFIPQKAQPPSWTRSDPYTPPVVST